MKKLFLICLCGLWSPSSFVGASALQISNLEKPGSVAVSNNGPTIRVKRRLIVEQETEGEWRSTGAYVDLVGRCIGPSNENCRQLSAGEIVRIVPWNGFSCSGQCMRPCRSNSYLGPGKFRFVVVTCDSKQRFVGESFALPAIAPGERIR